MNEEDLNKIVWEKFSENSQCQIREEGDSFIMDDMPFNLNFSHTDSVKFTYEQDSKKIVLIPIGYKWDNSLNIIPVKKVKGERGISDDNVTSVVSYNNIFNKGISIDNEVSKNGWKKIIKIDNLESLGSIPSNAKYLEFIFEIETDFDIKNKDGTPWNKKDQIIFTENVVLQNNLRIEKIKSWYFEGIQKQESASIGVFYEDQGKIYLKKQIEIDLIKKSIGVFYTDVSINYGSETQISTSVTPTVKVLCLSPNTFVVVYVTSVTFYGYARIGTVSGTSISYGSEFYFDTLAYIYNILDACLLDKNSFVISYAASNKYSFSRVGVISEGSISFGSSYQFGGNTVSNSSNFGLTSLSNSKFIIAYRDYEISFGGTMLVGNISGTSISYGSKFTLSGGLNSFEYPNFVTISSTSFVIAWRYYDNSSSYYGYIRAFSVSGNTITAGGNYTFQNSGFLSSLSLALLSPTKLILGYSYGDTTFYAETRTIDISGLVLTLNTAYSFKQYRAYNVNISSIDADSFNLIFYDNVDQKIYSTTGLSSNNVITYENIVAVYSGSASLFKQVFLSTNLFIISYVDNFSTFTKVIALTSFYGPKYPIQDAQISGIKIVKLTPTSFFIFWKSYYQGGYAYVVVANVTGTKITYGTPYLFTTAGYGSDSFCMTALTSTSVVAAYVMNSSNIGIVFSISGTVVTWGSTYPYTSDISSSRYTMGRINNTTALVVFDDYATSNATSMVLTVSGSVVTWGSKYNFYAGVAGYISLCILSETLFSVTYTFLSSTSYLYSIIGNISGTVISYGSPNLLSSVNTPALSTTKISPTSFLIAYYNATDKGKIMIANVSGTTVTTSIFSIFNSSLVSDIVLRTLRENYFILAYQIGSKEGISVIVKIKDSQITYSDQYTYNKDGIYTADTYYTDITVLSSSTFAVGFETVSSTPTYSSVTMIGSLSIGKKIDGIINVKWNGLNILKFNGK